MNSYDLVAAILQKDAVGIEEAFNKLMVEKIAKRLENAKKKMAKKIAKKTESC
jgi:hypothetical protein